MMWTRGNQTPGRWLPSAAMAALACAGTASGVIVQPEDPGTTLNTPPAGAFARWSNTAGVIAVAPNYVLTTRHQDGSDQLRNINLDGMIYSSVEQWFFDSGGDQIDLRLVRVETQTGQDAMFEDWLSVFAGTPNNKTYVLSGFGPQIGAEVDETDGTLAGYDWAGTQDNQNSLMFGQQRVTSVATLNGGRFDGMSVLTANFDAPGAFFRQDFEATLGPGDSGGGWLIWNNGEWQIAGLHHAVDLGQQPDAFFGQLMQGVNITPFASQIASLIEPLRGDFNLSNSLDTEDIDLLLANYGPGNEFDLDGDNQVDDNDLQFLVGFLAQSAIGDLDLNGAVDANDFGVFASNFGVSGFGWAGGDLNGDGIVDGNDFGLFASNFGFQAVVAPADQAAVSAFATTVPEPASLLVASAAAGAFLGRRRRRL